MSEITLITLLWHDYETWGIDPRQDRPAQFAALQTSCELEEIGEPIMLYCLSLIHISEPTRQLMSSRMPSSA